MYDAEAARVPTYWTPPATQLSLNPLYGDDFALPPSVPARASTQDNHDEENGNDLFEPTLAEKLAAAAAAAARGAGKQPATKREGMRITIRVTVCSYALLTGRGQHTDAHFAGCRTSRTA